MVCSICLEEIRSGHTVRMLCCKQDYCPECIFAWFQTSMTCPLCRSDCFSLKASIQQQSLERKPVTVTVREAVHLAVIGSILFPFLIQTSPTQGPIFVFLIIFAFFVRG